MPTDDVSTMPSAIVKSLLGAFQAVFSVLLTLSYGVFAARFGMVDPRTAKNISSLCVNMFLPALLITNVGNQINTHNFINYIPAFIWAGVYCVVSIILGKIATKLFKLPSWVVPACAFNNRTSLPLLMTQSLKSTNILESIAGNDVSDAVERAQSYFLINSMVSNVITFSIGQKLLGSDIMEENEDGDGNSQQNNCSDDEQAGESSSLLPKPITSRMAAAEDTASTQFNYLPQKVQSILLYIQSLISPTLLGAVLALVIGLTPPAHKAFFAETAQGGWLNAWFVSSLRNIGELFTSLQMFVVGSKLSDSFTPPRGLPSPRPPVKAIIVIFAIRFVFWGLISIPFIYFLAAKTQLLAADPMLWWSLMLVSSEVILRMFNVEYETDAYWTARHDSQLPSGARRNW
jgi:predicted permease